MTTGRDLDALVAEKVMGIPKIKAWTTSRGEDLYLGVKNYSTDIAAAWEVVEKLNLFRDCALIHRGEWVVIKEIGAVEHHFEVNVAFGQTAPHAICLAALKAVGHEL